MSKHPKESYELEKAVPGPGTSPYQMKEDYTGKDAKKAQINAVKNAMQLPHNAFKRAINPATGKDELHMLVHRGIKTDGSQLDSSHPRKGGYKFKIDPDTNTFNADTHTVNTLSHEAAHDYGDVHSFWVPVSHVSATSHYLAQRWKNPNIPVPQEEIDTHTEARQKAIKQMPETVKELQEAYDPKDADDFLVDHASNLFRQTPEQSAREQLSDHAQADDERHIIIKPGQYSLATEEELRGIDEKTDAKKLGSRKKLLDPTIKRKFYTKPVEKSIMDQHEVSEVLEKKCPRCGGSSANSSNPSGRCSACLKKLRTAKKTPGHWQRAQTKADDALRRQKGKNGTAHKKKSGLGSRKSIVKQTQSAEKKTGQKLSPDRKNNSKGYASSNTRMVPEKLNRGRHHVDEKKLRAWKKRLKKHDLDTASLYTLMKAKFQDNPEITELLKTVGPEGVAQYIDLFDIE
jgi:hypothetical protein